jgi:hypothetical protein
MRYEQKLTSGIVFYYEITGKQVDKLFAVYFSYGSVKDETDFQFHQEFLKRDSFSSMQSTIEELKKYCTNKGFKHVSTKH